MKNIFIAIVVGALAFVFTGQQAHAARGGVVYKAGDSIDVVREIPTDVVKALDLPRGVELGWKHFHFELFWVPFYGGFDGQYVLTNGDRGYYHLNRWQLAELGEALGMDLSQPYSPGIIRHFWGWFLVAALVIFQLGTKFLASQFSLDHQRQNDYSKIF